MVVSWARAAGKDCRGVVIIAMFLGFDVDQRDRGAVRG
jgi:hypothetical protein